MGASESKLAFKQSVFMLAGPDDIQPGHPCWAQFYTLPESAEDVFALWSPNDIRSLTSSSSDDPPPAHAQLQPKKNLETLVYTVVARLQLLQTTHVHPDSHASTASEILNCMRILTRLIPYIYEAEHLREWQQRFFWQPRKPTSVWDSKKNRAGKLFDGLQLGKEYAAEDKEKVLGPPLGETLLDIAVKYLFFAGFTLPRRLDTTDKPDLEPVVKVWQTGIGSNKSMNCTKENERNQMETLRLLLTLTSKTMYIPANAVSATNVEALTYLTTRLESRMVNGILCSLLNTLLKYNPNSWGLPLDLAAGPNDPKKMLVTYSIEALLVLAVYIVPSSVGDSSNRFRQSMGMLHRADDFQFIQQGLNQVLSQPVSGSFNVFQSREKAISWAPEMLSLLWELLQCNRRFRRYIIETGCALDYVVLVLYYAMDAKDDPSKQGVLRLCVFILQTLSADTAFSAKLNMGFSHSDTLPAIMRVPNFHGSYADFLICSIHSIITTTSGRLDSLYPALLAIINNVAPFQKNLARATSSKLMDLFTLLASPTFLMANESNHTLLSILLDAFNAVLEHRLEDNRRFVEILVGSRKRFKALQDFTIDGALAELNRQAQDCKDRGIESTGVRNDHHRASVDSIRSPPTSVRSPSLSTVTEDNRFAIGEDDEDEEVTTPPAAAQSSQTEVTADTAARMSEKARGKRPALLVSTSRTASVTSLATPSTTFVNQPHFNPSLEWLESWYPYLPLEPILQTIRREAHQRSTSSDVSNADFSRYSSNDAAADQPGRTSAQPAQLARHSGDAGPPSQGPNGQSDSIAAGDGARARPTSNFQWTPGAIGWYSALIWGRIYLQEAEAAHGSGGLYSGTHILLFRRSAMSQEISLRSPRGAIDAVGDSLARRFSSISMK